MQVWSLVWFLLVGWVGCSGPSTDGGTDDPTDDPMGRTTDTGNPTDTTTDTTGCEPLTCEVLAADCGAPDDGCGNPLDCGTCEGWLECGVNEPFVCGAECPEGCPPGATCSSEGVCVGADLGDLVFDVPTIEVSGAVTLNGAVPVNGPSCGVDDYATARVTFREVNRGYVVTADATCSTGHTFGPTQLFPGTYQIEVRGVYTDTTNLPIVSSVVQDGVVLQADRDDLALDVETREVAGAITLNGASPQNGPSCDVDDYSTGRVTFREVERGYVITTDATCSTDHGFGPAQVFPGIYQVSVRGVYTDTTNLPISEVVSVSRLEVP